MTGGVTMWQAVIVAENQTVARETVPCLTFNMAKFVKCLPVDATSISNEMEFLPLLLVCAQELVLIHEL
jgi:hypothetical protein